VLPVNLQKTRLVLIDCLIVIFCASSFNNISELSTLISLHQHDAEKRGPLQHDEANVIQGK
jgi:hypothetical protein